MQGCGVTLHLIHILGGGGSVSSSFFVRTAILSVCVCVARQARDLRSERGKLFLFRVFFVLSQFKLTKASKLCKFQRVFFRSDPGIATGRQVIDIDTSLQMDIASKYQNKTHMENSDCIMPVCCPRIFQKFYPHVFSFSINCIIFFCISLSFRFFSVCFPYTVLLCPVYSPLNSLLFPLYNVIFFPLTFLFPVPNSSAAKWGPPFFGT